MSPKIKVGILEAPLVRITLNGSYTLNGTAADGGTLEFTRTADGITLAGQGTSHAFRLHPDTPDAIATVSDVTIGIGFHWQQHEDQQFGGDLAVIQAGDKLAVVNEIDIEHYLLSVISSEMNATAPEEFLKAHAVISRSWALAQIRNRAGAGSIPCTETDDETVRWTDHAAHTLYDVCADDHCQRFQGNARAAASSRPVLAVTATAGEVLMYGSTLCDTRFSKCCGGITERFSTCWQPVDKPYLTPVTDSPDSHKADASGEAEFRQFLDNPHSDAFCANPPEAVLRSILNTYDRSTPHLYRWSVSYTGAELSDIIRRRSGRDYGRIIAIAPLHRGPSGRIDRLRITGTRLTRIIGKELEIRRTLSESHLYSSAFTVLSSEPDADGIPSRWTLRGAGWGHGVGLCQIGAAVMGTRGYSYRQILAHYFPGAELKQLY